MDTHTLPLFAPTSLQMQAVPDLPAHIAVFAAQHPDLPHLRQNLLHSLGLLDLHLSDPDARIVQFLHVPGDVGHVTNDRVALLRLCADLGVPMPYLHDPEFGPTLPPKRMLTDLEIVMVRRRALDRPKPATAVAVAVAEAGASHREASGLPHDALVRQGQDWFAAAPGDRDAVPRLVRLPRWCHPAVDGLLGTVTGPWLLTSSNTDDADRRSSAVQMLLLKVLRSVDLNRQPTVTPASIRRTALRRLALSGPDGWDAAVAAAGHRNPGVTGRLLRLHESW